MITVGKAKRIAQEWVEAEAPNIPHFRGAFQYGSTLWKNDDESQPETSDVDVKILIGLDDPKLIQEQGLIQQKRAYRGIILETAFSPFQEFSAPERVLADFAWAAHFSVPNILSDPSGELTKLQIAVAAQFPQKRWVIKRIEGAKDYALMLFDNTQTGIFKDRWLSLLYAVGGGIIMIPIQAELRAPTIRKGIIAFKQIMENHGRQDLHETLLKILGLQSMDRIDVERHLQDLSSTFDRALEIIQSPSQYGFIEPVSRPLVIDGSWEMIKGGFHREAMIWILGMRSECQETISQDGSDEEKKKYTEQYEKLLAELGLGSEDDFQKRAKDGKRLLDEVMRVSLEIVETNDKITN
jgi:hypothetical protein